MGRDDQICFFKSPILPVSIARHLLELRGDDLKGELDRLFKEPAVEAAIRLSSPSFYRDFTAKGEGEAPSFHLYNTLLNYLLRMSMRPTSFGLMASTAVGVLEKQTKLTEPVAQVEVVYRAQRQNSYALNPTAYRVGNKLYYHYWSDLKGVRNFEFRSFELSPKLEKLLGFFKSPKTAEVASKLLGESSDNRPLEKLLASGVLVVANDKVTLGNYSTRGVSLPGVISRGEAVYDAICLDQSTPSLSKKTMDQAARALSDLNRIFNSRYRSGSYHQMLDKFKKDFVEFYEDHQVPLLECISPFEGVGFPSGGMVEYKSFPEKMVEFIAKKIFSEDTQKRGEWELSNEDMTTLSSFGKDGQCFTSTDERFCVSAKLSLFDENGQGLLHPSYCGDPYAPHYRWGIGQADLSRELSKHLARSSEEVVFADIEFYPGRRTASYIRRPSLVEHYIPVTGFCDGARAIPMSDLYVNVSKGYISLWSKKLKKFVVPLAMHNYNFVHDPLPAVRFLNSVARQHCPDFIKWMWPRELEAKFLPRVRIGGLIVSPKSWRFPKAEFLANYKKEEFRKLHKLEKILNLMKGDSFVTIDLDDGERLEREIGKADSYTLNLEECWQANLVKTKRVVEASFPVNMAHENARLVEREELAEGIRSVDSFAENFSDFAAFQVLCSTLSGMDALKAIGKFLQKDFFYIFYPSQQPNKCQIRFRASGVLDYKVLNAYLARLREKGDIFDFEFKSYETDQPFFGHRDFEALTVFYQHASEFFLEQISKGDGGQDLFLDYAEYTTSLAERLGLDFSSFAQIKIGLQSKISKRLVKKFFDQRTKPKLIEFPAGDIEEKRKFFFRLLHMNSLRVSPSAGASFEAAMLECLRLMAKSS